MDGYIRSAFNIRYPFNPRRLTCEVLRLQVHPICSGKMPTELGCSTFTMPASPRTRDPQDLNMPALELLACCNSEPDIPYVFLHILQHQQH